MKKIMTYQEFPKWLIIPVIILSTYLVSGCATVPYRCGQDIEQINTLKLRPNEPQIERGRANKFIDSLGHFAFSLPSKIILMNLCGKKNVKAGNYSRFRVADRETENIRIDILSP